MEKEILNRRNVIRDLSFDFSLKVIELYKLLAEQHEFVISRQLLRSGTSIGANVEEAIEACSKKEFIYKMSLALKEARETKYWLGLLSAQTLVKLDVAELIKGANNIISILVKIVKSSKANSP